MNRKDALKAVSRRTVKRDEDEKEKKQEKQVQIPAKKQNTSTPQQNTKNIWNGYNTANKKDVLDLDESMWNPVGAAQLLPQYEAAYEMAKASKERGYQQGAQQIANRNKYLIGRQTGTGKKNNNRANIRDTVLDYTEFTTKRNQGVFDDETDVRSHSNSRLSLDPGFWEKEGKKAQEEVDRLNALINPKGGWQPNYEKLQGLYYNPKLEADIQNEQNIIDWAPGSSYYTEDDVKKAQERLAAYQYQKQNNVNAKNIAAHNWGDPKIQYTKTNGAWNVDNLIESGYDAINGKGAYKQRTAGMTAEEKNALDDTIREAILDIEPAETRYGKDLASAQSKLRFTQSQKEKAEKEIANRQKLEEVEAKSGAQMQRERELEEVENRMAIAEQLGNTNTPEYQNLKNRQRYLRSIAALKAMQEDEKWNQRWAEDPYASVDFRQELIPEPEEGLDSTGHYYINPQGTDAQKAYFWVNHQSYIRNDGSMFYGRDNEAWETEDMRDPRNVHEEQFMTSEMRRKFNEYYGDGTQDEQMNALAYLEALRPMLRYMRASYQEDWDREKASGNLGWLYGAATVPKNLAAGVVGVGRVAASMLGNEAARDPNSSWGDLSRSVATTREERGDVWENTFKGGKFLNQVVYSMADNIAAMAATMGVSSLAGIPAASNASKNIMQFIMSSEAMASTFQQELENDTDPTKAAIMSIADGVFEWYTENMGWDALMNANVKDMLGNRKDIMKYIAKNFGAEAGEEVSSGAMQWVFGNIYNAIEGHATEDEETIDRLVNVDGMDIREAEKQVFMGHIRDLAMEGLAGGLSGGVMGGGNVVKNSVSQTLIGNRAKEDMANVKKLVKAAGGMNEGTNSKAQAEAIQEKLDKGKKPTNYELGKLMQNISEETGAEVANIARGVISDVAATQLQERGMEGSEAREVADIIAEVVQEGDLSKIKRSQRDVLTRKKGALEVLRSFFSNLETVQETEKEIAKATSEHAERMQILQRTMEGKVGTQAGRKAIDVDVSRAIRRSVTASEAEMRAAGIDGKSAGALDVIVDGAKAELVSIAGDKATVVLGGNQEEVSIGDLKAANKGVAAVVDFTTRNKSLLSDAAANIALKGIQQNKRIDAATYLGDAVKIYGEAMALGALPKTKIDTKTAQEIFNQAKQEFAEQEAKRVLNQKKVKPGRGSAKVGDVAYGTDGWKQAVSGWTKQQRNQAGAVAEIAVRYGANVAFINDEEHSTTYGWENAKDGSITINVAAKGEDGSPRHMLTVFAHEMTHWLEQNSQDGYANLRQYIVDRMRQNGEDVADFMRQTMNERNAAMSMEEKEKGTQLSYADAMAELVANASDQIFRSEKLIQDLQKTNPSLFDKAKQFVKNFVARMNEAIKGIKDSTTRESRALKDDVDAIAMRWLYAKNEAINRKEGGAEATGEQKSMAQLEDRQAAAVIRGDTQAAHRLVEQYARRKGYTDKGFHGTDGFGFTKFDLEGSQGAIFIAYDQDLARTYTQADEIREIVQGGMDKASPQELAEILDRQEDALYFLGMKEEGEGTANIKYNEETGLIDIYERVYDDWDFDTSGHYELAASVTAEEALEGAKEQYESILREKHFPVGMAGIYQLYAKPGKQLVVDAKGAKWNDIKVEDVAGAKRSDFTLEDGMNLKTREVAAWAKEHGYDSVRINNVLDSGEYQNETSGSPHDIGIFFKESDVKSADNVTYDDEGNPISLEERFSDGSDIRWSKAQANKDTSDWKTYTQRNGVWYSRDGKGNTVKLEGADAEYVKAWNKGDYARMEELLAEKIRENGAIPFKAAVSYNQPDHMYIAKAIKRGDMQAVRTAAQHMAELVPDNAVLVPMPNHMGVADDSTDTMILAKEISRLTGRPVVAALEGVERESRQEDKKKPKSKQMKAEDLGFRKAADIPKGMVPYIVDNVIASGLTAEAAHKALGNNGVTLAYAKSTQSANDGLKRANVTFYDTNKQYGQYLIPLSERIDMEKTGYNGVKFSQAQIEKDYMDAVERGDMKTAQEAVKAEALAKGYSMNVYHGTPNGGFTEFRDWSYFTENKEYADRYQNPSASSIRGRYNEAKNPKTYGLFMNPGRIFDTTKSREAELYNKARKEYGLGSLDETDSGYPDWTNGRDLAEFIEENDLPYDTIILDEGADGGYGEEVKKRGLSYMTRSNMVKSADPVTYDKDGKVIPLSERFKKEKKDINFSMAQVVEQRKDGLVAVHNLTVQNLLDTLAEGAFTAPSVAVVKAQTGHEKYGPISVVFKPDAINPKTSRKNKVFGADAYTPERANAQVETKFVNKEVNNIRKSLMKTMEGAHEKLIEEADRWYHEKTYDDETTENAQSLAEKAYSNAGMLAAYQMAHGNKAEMQMRESIQNGTRAERETEYNAIFNAIYDAGLFDEFWKEIDNGNNAYKDEVIKKYSPYMIQAVPRMERWVSRYNGGDFKAGTILGQWLKETTAYLKDGIQREAVPDIYETRDKLASQTDKKDFIKWFSELAAPIFGEKGIRNDQDPYTAIGNRRTFKQLHIPYTVENIVKAMYKNAQEKGQGAHYAQGLMATASKEYGSMRDIKADSGRLQMFPEEEYQEIIDDLNKDMREFAEEIYPSYVGSGIQALVDAGRDYSRSRSTETIKRAMNRDYGIKLTDEQAKRAAEIMEKAREIPVGYFEAKPERVVGFDEIAKVILPENEELEAKLDDAGIPYELYDGTEKDRLDKLNSDDSYQFSQAQSDMNVNQWMLGLNPDDLVTEQERNLLKQYKEKRIAADIDRMAMTEQRAAIRRLEQKDKLTAFDKNELQKAYNRLQNWQNKLDRDENDLAKITSTEGYAGLMYRQQKLMNDLVNGRTAEEVRATTEALQRKMQDVEKEMAENKEHLDKLANAEGVVAAKTYFAGKGLRETAQRLKRNYMSSLNLGDIENRMASIALRLNQNGYNAEEVWDDITTLAQMLADKTKGAGEQSYILQELRGSTFYLSKTQMKELTNTHRTLRDVNKELAGTGIRIREGKAGNTTLDQVYDQYRETVPSLHDVADTEMLDELLDVVKREKASEQANLVNSNMGEVIQGVFEEAVTLAPTKDAGAGNKAQIDTLIKYISELSAEARTQAQTMDALQTAFGRMQRDVGEMKIKSRKLDTNIGDAINYFNTLTEQSEAVIWRGERAKLISQLKDEKTQALVAEQQRWKDRIEKDKEVRKIMDDNRLLGNQIHTVLKRTRRLLMNETDVKNIPEHMKGLARAMLEKIVVSDMTGRRRISKWSFQELEQIQKTLDGMKKQDGEFDPDDLEVIEDKDAQQSALDALADIEDGLALAKAPRTSKDIRENLQENRKAALLIQKGVTTIVNMINSQRMIDMEGRRILIEDAANDAIGYMEDSKFKGEYGGVIGKGIGKIRSFVITKNTTPVYFFKNLKNSTFSGLFKGHETGENASGLEFQKAKEALENLAKETGYSTWDQEKRYAVSLSGTKVNMTLEQMMFLYATWKREQNAGPEESQHLTMGGAVIDETDLRKGVYSRQKPNNRPHLVTEDDMKALEDMLTPEQKRWVDGVVGYMSGDLAELGNVASMKMYGVKKYKESYYFPFKTWTGNIAKTSDAGNESKVDKRAINPSFSRRRMRNARTALEIGNFTETAVDHIVGMIRYAEVGPANEYLQRVLNYKTTEEDGVKINVESRFQSAYGLDALRYLNQYIHDMNGGTVQAGDKSPQERLLSTFRKAAVAGSMSVTMQQPLSYIRAAMMVSPKYLAAAPKYWKGSHAERLKYSGVSVIKDMGRFDMGMGQSAKDFIMPERKTGMVKKAYGKISDWTTAAPEWADAITWNSMWGAVKAEQHAQHPDMDVKSDEFLTMVADRFNDLMRKTQVYDSVLVRSQSMRSQNIGWKMLTSFMAEPTLTLNVLTDAVANVKEKGGKMMLAKAGATFVVSAVLQAAVKALWSSGRTPDDKKTWEENFLYRFWYNIANEANPASMIPGYSDLVELLKNGELKDDALGIIGKFKDIKETVVNMVQGKGKGTYRDIEDSVGQIVQLFTNIPAKNMMRDARAMYNWAMPDTYASRATSGAVLKYQTIDSFANADTIINAILGEQGYKTSNTAYYKRIYAADKAGNKESSEEMKEYLTTGRGIKKDDLTENLRGLVKEDDDLTVEEKIQGLKDYGMKTVTSFITDQYKKGNLTRAEAEKLYKKESKNATDKTVLKVFDKADLDKAGVDTEDYTNYTPLKEAIEANKVESINKAIQYLLDNGYKAKEIQSQLYTLYGKDYVAMKGGTQEKVKLQNALTVALKGTGMTAERAKVVLDKTWEKKVAESATSDAKQELTEKFEAEDISAQTLKSELKKLYPGKTDKEIQKMVTEMKFEKETGIDADDIKDDYLNGLTTRSKFEKQLKTLNPNMDDNEVWFTIDQLDYQKETGKTPNAEKYYRIYDAIDNGKTGSLKRLWQDIFKHGASKKESDIVNTIWRHYGDKYMTASKTEQARLKNMMIIALQEAGVKNPQQKIEKKIKSYKPGK